METFPASTFAFLIGVVEDKLTGELILNEVHLSSDEHHESFVINDQLKIPTVNNFIELVMFCGIVHGVAEPIATSFGNSYFNPNLNKKQCYNWWIVLLGQQLLDPLLGPGGLS